ncbi:pentapeptide repeat protein [Psychromonas ingrahamii 37]|uniref:Pentapeptide repeat protein n=1 Tax=Psychromonas ingrahamii (strain DSM 17664 / CCUG 51855 / 37) TaxID=357804 RepID=A1SQY9_PSYIN|nr:pentapeptide repeat-containing protein [Psychromonas ingrahamii]ABM01904.1 pentapeptide repeat protein [Psychromonas ingrahamii 37]
MKSIKSLQASLLTNTFKYQQKHFFVASTLWGFYLDSGEAVLEQTLWPIIAANLGKDSLFDEAFKKDASEFVVFADAFAPQLQPAPRVDVSVSLAEITKILNVYGERYWQGFGPSPADPFMQMPLSYEHAYGGQAHLYNKDGKGLPGNDSNEVLRFLANIEHPDFPVISKKIPDNKSAYTPQGFAAINSEWPQRKNLYGTFDDNYLQNHMPGLAPDINWDYFHTAPPDQRFDRYLTGNEPFCITNMHETMAEIKGNLPGVVGRCFIEQELPLNALEQGELAQYSDAQKRDDKLVLFKEIPLNLDTVYFFPNDNIGIVVHRGTIEINHPQAKDIKKLLVAHQSLTEPAKPSAFYQDQLQLRCDPEDGFKYMMYSAPLIPEDVTCGFKQLLGDEEYKQVMGDNLSAFAEGKKQQAEQEMDEAIDKQVAELRANGMDKQADELLDKIKNPPQDIELPEDAKKLQALTDKILPGISAMKEAPKLDDLDLTKLNLKAMDEVQAHMEAMAEKQKKEALLKVEQQLDELKQQAAQQPEMAEQLDPSIKQLEEMLASIDAIPVLTRPDTVEQDTQLSAQLAQAAEQLTEQKKMMAEHNIELSAEQQQQMTELEQLLDNNETLSAQMAEANDFINDSYLKGAHFIAESSSPHKGKEPELVAALLDSYNAKQVITAKDFAFCKLTQQKFKQIDLNHGFFEYSELTHIEFEQADLTAINLAHAKLSNVSFDNCAIEGANLGAAELTACQFKNMKLIEITLAHSSLIDCEFTDCEFGERMDMLLETKLLRCKFVNCTFLKLNFIELDLTGCEFIDCDLSESNFIKPILTDASFTGSTLNGTNFVIAELNNSCFERARMKNTRFVGGCLLNEACFNFATINETNLRDCQLNNCDFSDADISKSDFGESSIKNSQFNCTIARQVQFIDSNLNGSQFKKADFMEANLMQADIRGCNFSGANLYGASFLNATLGSTSFYGAILENTLLKDWRP